MSSIKYYILNDNRGPIFDMPSDVQNSCAKIDYHAASINDAWDLIVSTFNKISSLSPDLEVIKSQIKSLEENWNNYAKIDDQIVESVFLDSLNNDINSITDSFDNGKLISGDAVNDSSTGTYGLANATTSDIESCVQGISTYHKDGKTYFVESRSYSSNTSQITVRDITNGTENSTVVGNHALPHQYSEAIHIDDDGQTYILYEGTSKVQYNVTDTININDVISKGNTKVTPMSTGTDKYNGGDEIEGGYIPKV